MGLLVPDVGQLLLDALELVLGEGHLTGSAEGQLTWSRPDPRLGWGGIFDIFVRFVVIWFVISLLALRCRAGDVHVELAHE